MKAIGPVLLFVVLATVIVGCQFVMREKAIDDCRARGGNPTTHPWWQSEQFFRPGCVEVGR